MLLSYCAYLYNGLRKYFHTSSGTIDHSKNGVQGGRALTIEMST